MKSYFPLILFVYTHGILQTDSAHYNFSNFPPQLPSTNSSFKYADFKLAN